MYTAAGLPLSFLNWAYGLFLGMWYAGASIFSTWCCHTRSPRYVRNVAVWVIIRPQLRWWSKTKAPFP